MSSPAVIYEQPLNERIRICLRIEALIDRLDYFHGLDSDHAAYQALLTVLEITALVGRGDVKQEIIKELDRQHKVLTALISHQRVDKSRLEISLNQLKQALNRMHAMDGRLGEHLKSIDFLLSVKQRSVIPGGSCDFDLPQLRYWLDRPIEARQRDLDRWAAPYRELNRTLSLILKNIRDSALAEPMEAGKGFFQEALDPAQPNQMLRIGIDDRRLFPEISAGKHRYSIRFMHYPDGVDPLPQQLRERVRFQLMRCTL
jgi:cell division protein ZapD